jgi:hypothetical protein
MYVSALKLISVTASKEKSNENWNSLKRNLLASLVVISDLK